MAENFDRACGRRPLIGPPPHHRDCECSSGDDSWAGRRSVRSSHGRASRPHAEVRDNFDRFDDSGASLASTSSASLVVDSRDNSFSGDFGRLLSSHSSRKARKSEAVDQRSETSAEQSRCEIQTDIPQLPEHLRLLEKLGEGGMGTVYRVRDVDLNRELAVKVMKREFVGDRAALKRFQKEALAAGDLTHQNIAQVYSCNAQSQSPYMVMEFVDGVSLSDVLRHERCLSPERAVNLGIQIADALEYAHQKGIVHRDLKPSNILVVQRGSNEDVKIVDFGIAKLNPTNDSVTALTHHGEIFGSPSYMSPEQARGLVVDHRSDIYSLGCILFEMLTGKKLFGGQNPIQILLQHISSPISARVEVLKKSGASRSLISVVKKMLEKNPKKRFRSAHEAASALRKIKSAMLIEAQDLAPSFASLALNLRKLNSISVKPSRAYAGALMCLVAFWVFAAVALYHCHPDKSLVIEPSPNAQLTESCETLVSCVVQQKRLPQKAPRRIVSHSVHRLSVDTHSDIPLVSNRPTQVKRIFIPPPASTCAALNALATTSEPDVQTIHSRPVHDDEPLKYANDWEREFAGNSQAP